MTEGFQGITNPDCVSRSPSMSEEIARAVEALGEDSAEKRLEELGDVSPEIEKAVRALFHATHVLCAPERLTTTLSYVRGLGFGALSVLPDENLKGAQSFYCVDMSFNQTAVP